MERQMKNENLFIIYLISSATYSTTCHDLQALIKCEIIIVKLSVRFMIKLLSSGRHGPEDWTEDRAEFLKLKLDEVLKTSVLLHDALWALGESKKIITIQALKANGLCNYEENAIASIRILDRESREMIEDKKWRISSEWSRWMSNRPEKRAGCYQWAITYRR